MNGIGIKKLTSLFTKIDDCVISLVLNAGHLPSQIYSIFSNFKITGYTNIILSKIDELSSFGHLLSIFNSNTKKIDYLTNGQEVPKDIMKFSSSFLAEKILQVD